MTIEPKCYVCGKEQPCIDGLCSECHMWELFNPGAAFAATFGSLPNPRFAVGDIVEVVDTNSTDADELWRVTEARWHAELKVYDYFLASVNDPNKWTIWGVLNLRAKEYKP